MIINKEKIYLNINPYMIFDITLIIIFRGVAIAKTKETLYDILNVEEDAESIEIKKAFKKLARLFHPDLVANSKDAELKAKSEFEMKKLNIAKETLLDPKKRKKYDSKLESFRTKSEEISFTVMDTDDSVDELDIDWSMDISNEESDIKENEEIDWELQDEYEYEYEYEDARIIQTPPAPSEPPSSNYPSTGNTLGFEVAPGVLFLQKCISCGKVNFYGTTYCLGCYSSLIFDNQSMFSPMQNPDQSTGPPTRPGFKPENRPGMIVIKRCLRCGEVNDNNNPYCLNCNSSLVYYQRKMSLEKSTMNSYSSHSSPTSEYGVFECSKCGAENDSGREYCYSCFAYLHEDQKPIVLNPFQKTKHGHFESPRHDGRYKLCPSCGGYNYNYRDFCVRCNTRLVYDQPPIEVRNDPDGEEFTKYPKPIRKVDCPHCGAENSIGEEICTSCYKNILSVNKSVHDDDVRTDLNDMTSNIRIRYFGFKTCPRCGLENDPNERVCLDCGFKFRENV